MRRYTFKCINGGFVKKARGKARKALGVRRTLSVGRNKPASAKAGE